MSFPNQLSLLRIILTPVFLFLFLSENLFYRKLSLAVFLIAVITDWYDGWHARKYGLISKFGIFLDPLADKILTSSAFIGFYILGIMPLWMVIAIVVRDIVITLMRSYEEYKGRTLKTSYAAKTKTFIQMSYIFLIVIIVNILSFNFSYELNSELNRFLSSDLNFFIMLFVTIITIYTGVTYFFERNNPTFQTTSDN